MENERNPENSRRQEVALAPVIPRPIAAGVVLLTFIPLLLTLLGVDFGLGIQVPSGPFWSSLDESDRTLNLYAAMAGSQVHTLLEWSAIIIALLTALLAFNQYGISGNLAAPVIALALAGAGIMDAFHVLASTRIIDTVADNTELMPFSWALARIYSALLLLLALGAMVLGGLNRQVQNPGSFLVATASLFVLLGYALVLWSSSSATVPQAIFVDDLVKRPYDVLPLVIYIFIGAFVLPRFRQKYPGIFTDALSLSLVPAIVTELHMVFGSTAVYDSHFVIAHSLKVLCYAIPFGGLLLDYHYTYKLDKLKTAQLHQTYRELQARSQELLKSNRNLEESSRFKSEFMASVTHELRTPLNSVIGFGRILMKGFSDQKSSREYRAVEAIFRNSTHLLGLINDILDLSKIDAGRMTLEKSEFFVSDTVNEVHSLLLPLAQRKNLDFSVLNYARNVKVVSDQTKFKQVLVNLCSNAIKYTERGSVTLLVERGEHSELGDAIKISIKDTGIGIAENEKAQLFKEFGRTEDARKRSIEGTGLGLMISAGLVTVLGGEIDFDSEYGVGSEFRVCFPIFGFAEALAEEQQEDSGPSSESGLVVACFDPDLDALRYVQMAMSEHPLHLISESNIKKAPLVCQESLPDAIFVDAPADCAALVRKLKYHSRETETPVVVMSADHDLADEVVRQGADAFLGKPFTHNGLLELAMKTVYRDVSSVLLVGVEDAHKAVLAQEFDDIFIHAFFVNDHFQALEKLTQFLPDIIVVNLGNEQLEVARLVLPLNNDENKSRLPQLFFNGLDSPKTSVYDGEAQLELRLAKPDAAQLVDAFFTVRRRYRRKLQRIDGVQKNLHALHKDSVPVAVEDETSSETTERILLVDNASGTAELTDWIFNDAQLTHDCASTGRQALKLVLQNSYNLIFVDAKLPDLDGKEVVRRLRATNRYRNTPIVALSDDNADSKEQLLEYGFNEVLSKPVDSDILIAAARKYLGL